jgi:hypothetical protein
MTNTVHDATTHPSLDLENPLLQAIGPYINTAEWPSRLSHNPLRGIDRATLSEETREIFLGRIRERYITSDSSIQIARSIQRMVRRGYARRNPLLPEARYRTSQVLALRGQLQSAAPWLSTFADGTTIQGCTGLGKSSTLERVLGTCFPKVYVHPRCDRAGWLQHVQVTHLVVVMPVHRGGLLYAILAALDEAIGTTYRYQYLKQGWTIDKLSIEVAVLLAQHSVGVLVIEELQPRNFCCSPERDEMLLMLLRVLNFGIPIVLVGNPLAFVAIDNHGQDIRRLTATEPTHLMPLASYDESWCLAVEAMWGYNVMPKATPFNEEIKAELDLCSGGIYDFLWKAVQGSQQIALDTGDRSVTVQHLQRYRAESESYASCRDLIDGFRERDPWKLSRYLDVPWEEYGIRWGKLNSADIANADSDTTSCAFKADSEDAKKFRTAHQTLCQTLASKTAAAARKSRANTSARASASPDDLRSGNKAALTAGLENLRARGKG